MPCIHTHHTTLPATQRAVRLEAARLLGQLVAIAGRAATPHLRMLMGPWVAAQQDPHAETVSAARSAFQVMTSVDVVHMIFVCQHYLCTQRHDKK